MVDFYTVKKFCGSAGGLLIAFAVFDASAVLFLIFENLFGLPGKQFSREPFYGFWYVQFYFHFDSKKQGRLKTPLIIKETVEKSILSF